MRLMNFSAGPSQLPEEVIFTVQNSIIDYEGRGFSILELHHRSEAYDNIMSCLKRRLLELTGLKSDDFDVLVFGGGGRMHFASVPQNYLSPKRPAGYVVSGYWSEQAKDEAARVGPVYTVASGKTEGGYTRFPLRSDYRLKKNTSYIHVTTNSTIEGIQMNEHMEDPGYPIVADMSSDILSRSMDFSRFAMIYAAAQKNLGISGVSLVIKKKHALSDLQNPIPCIWSYEHHASQNHPYNTPPVFGVYVMHLMLEWIYSRGGIQAMEKQNIAKSNKMYDLIDASDGFYKSRVERDFRSKMNVTFELANQKLETEFLLMAQKNGFVGLAGHRVHGGIRVSLYNAIPLNQVEKLVEFMNRFAQQFA